MGIRLSTKWPEPKSHAFPDGVVVRMREATSVEHLAAQAAVRDKLDTLRDAAETLEILAFAGIDLGAAPLAKIAESPQYALGLSQHLMAVELGSMIVESWENVADARGEPASITRGALGAFFLDEGRLRRFQQIAYGSAED